VDGVFSSWSWVLVFLGEDHGGERIVFLVIEKIPSDTPS